jgi:methionyl-tRNA formyltransferase
MNVIFFGSFQHYSTLILQSLHQHPDINVLAVVTTPPMPAGRKQIITKTHTHSWAESHQIPIFTPEKLDQPSLAKLTSWPNFSEPASHPERSRSDVTDQEVEGPASNNTPDFFVVAGFGKLLPPAWLTYPKYGSLNIHFSLLPKYRGANPAEWAILMGESQTGISLITMNPKIDAGDIITQHTIKIRPQDSRETLYTKLYTLSARQSPDDILKYYHWLQKKDSTCQTSLAPRAQQFSVPPYARLLKRNDGFLPWNTILKAINGTTLKPRDFTTPLFSDIFKFLPSTSDVSIPRYSHTSLVQLINRSSRALISYPGLWTIVPTTKGDKRLKIHTTSVYKNKLKLGTVQLEGLPQTPFSQIKNQLQGPIL